MTTSAPSPNHLVARVVWDSAFDRPSDVRAQQDWLSEFTRGPLPDLLEQVFDRCCPPGHTWRCDQLEIDLGSIQMSRADHDLPQRLVRELTSALWRRFGAITDAAMASPLAAGLAAGTANAGPAGSDAHGQAGENLLSLLEHLLLHGTLPWWQKRQAPFLSLWGMALDHEASALLLLLRRTATQERVRLRLVWLLGPGRLPALITLADPAHADALVDWVRDLVARHVEEKLVQDDTSGFEQAAWLALLTCLFTERGSLFNLTDFARAHLRHLARHYGVAYEALLDRLDQISRRAAPHLPPRFLNLIRAILSRDAAAVRADDTVPVVDARAERDWAQWSRMLSRGQGEMTLPADGQSGGGTVRLQALFTLLAGRDGRRLARTMVAVGGPAGAILARHLDDPSLRRTVALLQPGEADFILAHVAHSQHLAQRRHWPRRAVWDVVLTFLLSEHTSRFERRQLVEHTLRESCRRHSTDFAPALALLIAYAQVAGTDPRHYVLLQILLDLQAGLAVGGAVPPFIPSSSHRERATDIWMANPTGATAQADRPHTTNNRSASGMEGTLAKALPAALLWQALRWRLRMGRTTASLPPVLRRMPLGDLWQMLPPADLRRWLLAQPDRAHLLPQLSAIPAARRWLSRLVPHALRPLDSLLDQAVIWFGGAGQKAVTRSLLEPVIWQLALDPRAAALAPARFVAQCLLLWCQRLGLSVTATAARGLAAPPSPLWRDAFVILLGWAEGRGIDPLPMAGSNPGRPAQPDAWGQWLDTPQGQALVLRLICQYAPLALHRRHGVSLLPAVASPDQRLASAIYQWAWVRPDSFRRLLARPWHRPSVRPRLEARLRAALSLPHLLDLIARDATAPSAAKQAGRLIGEWQVWQRRLNLPHAGRREAWLWRTIWQAWLDQDWRALEPARLLAAFRQFFLPIAGLNAARLDERLLAARPPAAILSALSPATPDRRPPMPPSIPLSNTGLDGQRLPISNAGLVLLQSYMPALFDRLSLLRDRQFVSPAAAHRALLALQFLACGFIHAEEPHLVLNKVLCGLEPSAPVPVQTDFTDVEVAMMEGLLRAIIGHWPASGASSLEGFRGNWLLRDGVLSDNSDHWGLTVMRKPWDVLLSKSPFSYAVIKMPWMARAVYVTWPI